MKTFSGICVLAVLLGISSIAYGQQQDEFFLAPGYKVTLAVDNSVNLALIVLDVGGVIHQTSSRCRGLDDQRKRYQSARSI